MHVQAVQLVVVFSWAASVLVRHILIWGQGLCYLYLLNNFGNVFLQLTYPGNTFACEEVNEQSALGL